VWREGAKEHTSRDTPPAKSIHLETDLLQTAHFSRHLRSTLLETPQEHTSRDTSYKEHTCSDTSCTQPPRLQSHLPEQSQDSFLDCPHGVLAPPPLSRFFCVRVRVFVGCGCGVGGVWVGVNTYTGFDIRSTKVMLGAVSSYSAASLVLLVRQLEAFYFSHT